MSSESFPGSRESVNAKEKPVEYHLLTGHNRSDGSYKSGEELRAEYVQLTDELIDKMFDTVESEEGVERELWPDTVVFLDKSARPVSWLVKDLWNEFAADSEGYVPSMPDFKYVNIDRNQWINDVDPNGVGMVDVERTGKNVLRSLRSIFTDTRYKREGLTEAIDEAPTYLDGQNVLIVDEVRSSGKTLQIATKFFEAAFPDAQIRGAYWMEGIIQKNGATGNADLPVWYKEKVDTGRGVGPRLEKDQASTSPSVTQRLGSVFLSTTVLHPDHASKTLRYELDGLAADAKHGRMLVMPSIERDDFIERVARYNHGMTLEQFKQAKRALQNHSR